MPLTDDEKRLLGEAAKLLLLVQTNKLPDTHLIVPGGMTWDDLGSLLDDFDLEDELSNNVEVADNALQDTANALANLHRIAADDTVAMPSDAQVESMKEKLGELSRHLQGDQNFERSAALAGALAGLIENA